MIAGSIFVFYALIGFTLYVFQESFIFLGQPLDDDHKYSFKSKFKEITYEMGDGASINALHFESNDPKGIILYNHGNAGNLERWGEIAEYFLQYQYDVLIYDYRGYGKSKGNRSEKTLHADAQYIYDQLKLTWKEEKIIIYGRSLGSGMACQLVANNSPRLLILEAPFYSLESMASSRFPIYPSKLLSKYEFSNWKNLQASTVPVVIFHGTDDEVVPYQFGEKLYRTVPNRATLVTIENGSHNDLVHYPEYQLNLRQILNQ